MKRIITLKQIFLKFWLFLVMGLTVVVFNSCDKNNNNGNSNTENPVNNGNQNIENPFIGTWKGESLISYEDSVYRIPLTITFNADKTFLNFTEERSSTGTYSYLENYKILTFIHQGGLEESYPYDFIGNDLVLSVLTHSGSQNSIFTKQ